MEIENVWLVRGRDEMNKECIFIEDEEIDPFDFSRLERRAFKSLEFATEDCGCFRTPVNLYVSGPTMGQSTAIATAISAAFHLRIPLTIYYYNRETAEYVPQTIFDSQYFVENDL